MEKKILKKFNWLKRIIGFGEKLPSGGKVL
jgi:hypothetical protein